MAYNDSGELPVSQSTYSLGGYTFELKVQTVHEPGEPDVVSVFAICRSPDGSRETVPMDFSEGAIVESWSVETNETEATVYAVVKENTNPFDFPPFGSAVITENQYSSRWWNHYSVPVNATQPTPGSGLITAASTFYTVDNDQSSVYRARSYTYAGKTVYWIGASDNGYWTGPTYDGDLHSYGTSEQIAWTMVYGSFDDSGSERMIARFEIDLREADGGPDGSWDEPGDVGPKNKKLIITVIGANTGTHDQTVFPSDNETVKWYGFGGDGGYGGGGGAGTSTVIIYDYATDLADEVEEDAIIRYPHGVGSGGGKGGKGGDGCILIFY